MVVTGPEARSRMGHHPLVYHTFNVTNNNAAVNIEVSYKRCVDAKLFVFIKIYLSVVPQKIMHEL